MIEKHLHTHITAPQVEVENVIDLGGAKGRSIQVNQT